MSVQGDRFEGPRERPPDSLSPWWQIAVIMVLAVSFTVLIWLSSRSYSDAPPIPDHTVGTAGEAVFTREDILAGQQVFLKHGLMENGSIWGHGAYLGPDFSAEYLHTLSQDLSREMAQQHYGKDFGILAESEQRAVTAEVGVALKQNRYEAQRQVLVLLPAEVASYRQQVQKWREYFADSKRNFGLPSNAIDDAHELRQLTAFFAWTAWASVANRPGLDSSYTNNFPYDPAAGNHPSRDALVWSALSLIGLLGGTAAVLFAFGRFGFLGWKASAAHAHPPPPAGTGTAGQRATAKYFLVVALLFLVQSLLGAATAHYRTGPASFFGIEMNGLLPSNLARTWHLQLAIFWVATGYVAGGLFLAGSLSGRDPKGQVFGTNLLFGALLLVVVGSLLGEALGLGQRLGDLWFWVGHQGWEYLDLGRMWQVLLAAGLVLWVILLFRSMRLVRHDPQRNGLASLFLYAALAIPLFYLPAMFFDSTTHFTVVDTWRFWIIHLWVEGFFEVFVTVMVAIIFHSLGLVSQRTAMRVVYLDAILFLGSGVVGTGHHWYWTGQSNVTMALGALFSALEVVPLTLLTLDAWDFVRLTRGTCSVCGEKVDNAHQWAFRFLMAVGFWNFVGAGVFGFLINLPIVSYFEVGTTLTLNHGHAAMMGVFGMLAVGLLVFALRQMAPDPAWRAAERYIRVAFWGLNGGLALMVLTSLFPIGILQMKEVLTNGYWHARSAEFFNEGTILLLNWIRLPADLLFIVLGVIPLLIATTLVTAASWRSHPDSVEVS